MVPHCWEVGTLHGLHDRKREQWDARDRLIPRCLRRLLRDDPGFQRNRQRSVGGTIVHQSRGLARIRRNNQKERLLQSRTFEGIQLSAAFGWIALLRVLDRDFHGRVTDRGAYRRVSKLIHAARVLIAVQDSISVEFADDGDVMVAFDRVAQVHGLEGDFLRLFRSCGHHQPGREK